MDTATDTFPRLTDFTAAQTRDLRLQDSVRWLRCMHRSSGRLHGALLAFEADYPRSVHLDAMRKHVELQVKGAVAAGSTTHASWAGPLTGTVPFADEWLALIRARSVIGRIPGLRRVPFGVTVPVQTAGGAYAWVGQGLAKPVTKIDLTTATLTWAKATGLIILSAELVKLSSPSADRLIREELASGIARFVDQQFLDATVAAVADTNPASVSNGAPSAAASGTTAAAALTDFKALLSAFFAANADAEAPVLILSPSNAVALAVALNAQTLGANGGSVFGIPVIASTSAGASIVLLDAAQILMAEDDALVIDVSDQATVQLDSAPSNPTTAADVLVPLWQQNLAGFRAERYITWTRPRTNSVRLITAAAYA